MSNNVQGDWFLTDGETDELRQKVDMAHAGLLSQIARVHECDWVRKLPGVSDWSASEIVEHVLLAEQAIQGQILQHMPDDPRPDLFPHMQSQRVKLELILPRAGKAVTTGPLMSFKGMRIADVAALLENCRRSYERTLALSQARPVKTIAWANRFFGELSMHLWLLYIPLHTERHARQVQRIADALSGLSTA